MADVYGIEVPDMPNGYLPTDVVVLVKALGEDGKARYIELRSPGMSSIEALGMLTTAADSCRVAAQRGSRYLYGEDD